MLVALLSTLEPAGEGATCPRAFLKVAGRSVIERQAELALAMGCERVICFAAGIAPELLAAQHMVERSGKRFHLLRTVDALRAQVTAADELLVLADGALPDRGTLADVVGGQRGVPAFPSEQGLAAGFERLDRDWVWSGVVRCGGGELERMADLPPDIDPLSALMRAALQAGRTMRPLAADILAEERWPLIATAEQARRAGRRTVAERSSSADWTSPGNALIDRLVRLNADSLLRHGQSGSALLGVAGVTALAGVVAAGAGFLATGLILVGVCAGALRARSGLARLRDAVRAGPRIDPAIGEDLALIGSVIAHAGMASWHTAGYPLLVLLALLHLIARSGPQSFQPLAGDRLSLALTLALAAWQDALGLTLQAISLLVLALWLFAHRPARLTGA